MKRVLFFAAIIAMCIAHAGAAVRDGAAVRSTQKRITTTVTDRGTTQRTTVLGNGRGTTTRPATTSARGASSVVNRAATTPTKVTQNISARATTQGQSLVSETRTGVAYETCKSAFFTCMDQFCALKNDDYRRCSCSNRIATLEKQRDTLTEAGEKLTVFTENLDVVGMTAAQATAMRTPSDGENALANDTSASKALLQAIMNSISGGDTTVSGKYSDLNTINMSYDLTTAFGTDGNQIIASYNGQDLYSAVYPQCRHAVADDCNTASLQRAVNAYLMAIEQDCNTVQTAINDKRSKTKSAIRESSAMLDLARVENRRKHNSDDITTCINNVEAAILSEEVCGANYHKCLDNGEFIDVSTGAPIAGVIKFYELGKLLTFTPGVDAANQKLSKRSSNRIFVSNFENRTKKFAKPALDKCTEIADTVWSEYLDKAMLAIYYAQQAKVSEIKQGCFDFITTCYSDSGTSITAAMSELAGSGLTILQPDKIALSTQMCTDYVESCNNMFKDEAAGDIITQYVNNRQETDKLAACRAVVKQCFDKYGGAGYENFYYPYSGLFKTGTAGDWFTLYDKTSSENTTGYKSPCAKQLTTIEACNNETIIEKAFGGFDLFYTKKDDNDEDNQLLFNITTSSDDIPRYGTKLDTGENKMYNRVLRPVGVATEIYNQIIDTLSTQCANINGRFIERQFVKEYLYGGQNSKNLCLWYPKETEKSAYTSYKQIAGLYGIFTPGTEEEIPETFSGENMCPRDYTLNVDTSFWGICSCWENGARRSKNGKNATCVSVLPAKQKNTAQQDGDENDDTGDNNNETTDNTQTPIQDDYCYAIDKDQAVVWNYDLSDSETSSLYYWCTQSLNQKNQVCPYGYVQAVNTNNEIVCSPTEEREQLDSGLLKFIPEGMD